MGHLQTAIDHFFSISNFNQFYPWMSIFMYNHIWAFLLLLLFFAVILLLCVMFLEKQIVPVTTTTTLRFAIDNLFRISIFN